MEEVKVWLMTTGITVLTNLVYALLIFVIGKMIARIVASLLAKAMQKSKIDETLVLFAKNVSYAIMMVVVVIAALSKLGLNTTSLVAVLGAAGLAIGLALQGSLSNFAAGVLLILFRPFKVGDFVDAGGVKGTVKDIDVFTSTLFTPDNVCMVVPNSNITGSNIINYSKNSTRRVDLVMSVSYSDDLQLAKQVIEEVLKAEPRVLADPAYTVAVSELAESSVNIVVRPWVNAADYWGVYFGLTESLKLALEAKGLTIPFPQRDVHLIGSSDNAKSVV